MTNETEASRIETIISNGKWQELLSSYLRTLNRVGIKYLPIANTCDGMDEMKPNSVTTQDRVSEADTSQSRLAVEPTSSYVESAPVLYVGSTAMNARKQNKAGDSSNRLAIMATEVANCTQCAHLAQSRTQTVFGVGNANARLCFVGEAPGVEEDKQGIPFVGRAGQLLDNILSACNLTREDIYILNTIKCRPPNNRNPSEEEIGNCWGYALRQIDILQPEFICCLGTVAAQTVLQTKESIGKLRGRFHDFGGIKVIATYHPAYLLRNPNAKKQVWEDMKDLMREMGTPVD